MTSAWRARRNIGRDPDDRELGRDPADHADLQPAVGQVIEHCDLFDHPPRRRVRTDRAEHAEAQPRRAGGDVRDQQVGRRAVGRAEVVLAEEDAFEVAGVGPCPQVEVPVEVVVHRLRIGSSLLVEWLVEELEQPRLDHVGSPARR